MNETTPLISIIIPVYNAEKYLVECINSVIQQSYKNSEIIIVNDGSTDGSESICNEYQKVDGRIKIISQKNQGVSSARNVGLEASKGEYITFIDADDCIEPETYETLINLTIKNKSDIATIANQSIYKNKGKTKETISNIEALKLLCKLELPSSVWAYVYKRSIVKEVLFSKNTYFFEDLEFNYLAFTKANKISLTYKNLYLYRVHAESTNHQNISLKKLSCLDVAKEIRSSTEKKHQVKELIFFETHILSSIIKSIPSSEKSINEEIYKKIHQSAKTTLATSLLKPQSRIFDKIVIAAFLIHAKTLFFLVKTIRATKLKYKNKNLNKYRIKFRR